MQNSRFNTLEKLQKEYPQLKSKEGLRLYRSIRMFLFYASEQERSYDELLELKTSTILKDHITRNFMIKLSRSELESDIHLASDLSDLLDIRRFRISPEDAARRNPCRRLFT